MYWLAGLSLGQQFERAASLLILQERYLRALLTDIIIHCRLLQYRCLERTSLHALLLQRRVVAFWHHWLTSYWMEALLSLGNMNWLADIMMPMARTRLGVRFTLVLIVESKLSVLMVSCSFSCFASWVCFMLNWFWLVWCQFCILANLWFYVLYWLKLPICEGASISCRFLLPSFLIMSLVFLLDIEFFVLSCIFGLSLWLHGFRLRGASPLCWLLGWSVTYMRL